METSRHILAAVDRGPTAEAVAGPALRLGAALGAIVTVLHVMTDPELADDRADLPAEHAGIDQVRDRVRDDLAQRIATVVENGSPTPVTRVVLGEPGAEILRILDEEDYAYVVVGVRNRSRVGKFILGSVTQDVLLGSPCPILAVPV